jgi:hypothetical protein
MMDEGRRLVPIVRRGMWTTWTIHTRCVPLAVHGFSAPKALFYA